MNKDNIGKRLRRQRETLGYTREEFSERVGISPQFLAEIENGKKGMSAETLYKLCTENNISADYILFGKINDSFDSPLASLIKEISPEYTTILEDIIVSFREAIELKKDK